MIDVCLLGTGGMLPLPERFLTSLYVRCAGKALLIDCGEGTQTAIRTANLHFKCIDGILITHYHADHVSGLPGLLLTLGNENRTEPLHLYGPRGLEQTVNALRVIVPELPYEIIFHEMHEETKFSCAGFEVTAFEADHGMPCMGYGISLPRQGKFDPQRAKEKGIPVQLWSRLQRGECAEGYLPEDVLGAPRKGISLLYATDTRPVAAIERLGAEVDLLILEGMFGDLDKMERAKKSRHMMMQEAARIAANANVRELWLTHFSPANPEPELYEEELSGVFPNTIIGTDGMMKTLRFGNEE